MKDRSRNAIKWGLEDGGRPGVRGAERRNG
jgi:hypothetical protein